MSNYITPKKYFFRLHHIRPRFKNDVENVLGYVAFGIAEIGTLPTTDFNEALDKYIRSYGTNARVKEKTIKNWRTEIAALFGMYIDDAGVSSGTSVSVDLANNSNLPKFFRNFIYSFQYPGGHLKSNEIIKIVEEGISFHPGRWLAQLFLSRNDAYITHAEFCHCALNDLRVTRDHESLETTYARILSNRDSNAKYDTHGDVVRYAGDILDYMVLGDLLETDNGRFYRKNETADLLLLLKNSNNFFDKYAVTDPSNPAINALEPNWFKYVEKSYNDFSKQAETLRHQSTTIEPVTIPIAMHGNTEATNTAETGELGENLTLTHEKLRIHAAGRDDLVHLIKRIPTHLAMGYDIKSIEASTEELRAIEVKSSISKTPVVFKRIHLTTNEWRIAENLGDKYFVYRLQIDDTGYRLFIIQNPVRKYKQDIIKMIPRDGADIIFEDSAGEYVELLCVH
jgi:hypothetical protein